MKTNSNRTSLIIGALFAVLAVGWFATRDSQPSVGVKTLAVASIKRDDVQRVTITVPGKEKKVEGAPTDGPVAPAEREPAQTVVLEKSGAAFVVHGADAKASFPVEQSQVDALLDAIAEFSPGDRIASDKNKLGDFELEDDQALRIVVAGSSGPGIDLLFGRAAKDGGTTVRQQGKSDVFVAKGRLGALAKKDLGQWRKKSVLQKKPEDFQSVRIARADGSAVVVTSRTEEVPAPPPPTPPTDGAELPPPAPPTKKTTWSLTEPAAMPAGYRLDTTALSRVAASLATLRAADFADGTTDQQAGFGAPHTTITGTLVGGGSVVLHLGSKNDKGQIHARIDGDTQVYLLPEYTAKNLDRGLDDFRELTLLTATADSLVQATFVSGKTRVVIKKDGADWKLVEPKTAPAGFEITQATSVVQAALRLRGSRLMADVTAATIGAGDPTIELQLAGGAKQTVRFGKAPDGATDIPTLGADGLVYAVNAPSKARYNTPLELFKKPAAPPPGMGGMGGGGGMSGLESLPPDVRKKLEASLKQQGLGN
jgi:hypothetical protein